MKFSFNQFKKFKTKNGAYSIVTQREHYDSQITATDAEAELLIEYFGVKNIHVGNVNSNKILAKKQFRLYPEGNTIDLNLVFPKPAKTELRLYLSKNAGFKPEPGKIWFVFVFDQEIWIGEMSEILWRTENLEIIADETDLIYQNLINEEDKIRIGKLREREVYIRDRELALKRMKYAGYRCEVNSIHKTFISRSTSKPYLESHHLIPMSLQDQFNISLDFLDNIFCLCPLCHRAIHHAEKSHTIKIINRLTNSRKNLLNKVGLSNQDFYRFYSVEEIV